MSEENAPEGDGSSPARGLAGLIAANLSLVAAVMVYMGWAYEAAFYGYFHLNPMDIGIGAQDYVIFSLNLFNPVIVLAIVVVIGAVAAATRAEALAAAAAAATSKAARLVRTSPRLRWLDRKIPSGITQRWPDLKQRWWKPQAIMTGLGIAMTATALILYGIADLVPVSTYLVLALLASGPLLLTGASRRSRQGRASYSLAIVVFIVCGLWAGSLYASGLGNRAARDFAAHLRVKTEVAVDSVQPLALSGTGVSVQKLPAGFLYHYRYEGLRLLYMNSGTYYLLPVGWIPRLPLTFILNASDQTSVELY